MEDELFTDIDELDDKKDDYDKAFEIEDDDDVEYPDDDTSYPVE